MSAEAATGTPVSCADCANIEHHSDGYSVLQCKLGYWRAVMELGIFPKEELPSEMPCGGEKFIQRVPQLPIIEWKA
jgi:hypothetical protein